MLRAMDMEYCLEILFFFFPFIIIVLVLFPSIGFLYTQNALEEHTTSPFLIYIIAKQWYWTITYAFGEIEIEKILPPTLGKEKIFSYDVLGKENNEARLLTVENDIYVPSGYPLRLLVTSLDVIHSFALPQLGIKMDALPGRLAHTTVVVVTAGRYLGMCSELCGAYHGYMPIAVTVLPLPNFLNWYFIGHQTDWEKRQFFFRTLEGSIEALPLKERQRMRLSEREPMFPIDFLYWSAAEIMEIYKAIEKKLETQDLTPYNWYDRFWLEIGDHPKKISSPWRELKLLTVVVCWLGMQCCFWQFMHDCARLQDQDPLTRVIYKGILVDAFLAY